MNGDNDKHKIFDDIYGLVCFNDAEKRVIDSPAFQRLRKIKQLGFSHLVFPGATHNRFSHSIGTLAVAQRVVKPLDLDDEMTKDLRMAALLHDIGQFPLSHTIEKVYIDEQGRRQLVNETKKTTKISISLLPVEEQIKNHEDMGADIITKTNFDNGITKILKEEHYEPVKIANIVTGDSENLILNQLMHSEIDIDKMDYLKRDSKNAGIMYGACDIDYLISNMMLENDGKVLFFKLKALKAIEHFFMTRYFYFTQILYHKTRSVIEYMAREVYKKAIELNLEIYGKPIYKDNNLKDLYTLDNQKEDFFNFDDFYFYGVLNAIKNEKRADSKFKEYADVLIKRNPHPTLIKEKFERFMKNDKKTMESKEKQFREGQEDDEIRIIEKFNILDNYNEIKKYPLEVKGNLLYEHDEAVRLKIPDKYDYPDKELFLSQFKDTFLKQFADYTFRLYRTYKFP